MRLTSFAGLRRSVVARVLPLAGVLVICSAHVGSPDVWYDGMAGPYRVLVHVETPVVIPGIAGVNVRVTGGGVDRVTAFVNRFDATGGAPPPEVAKPITERPGWYRTELWVMTSGSNSVTVGVAGTEGSGAAVVPVVAVPMRRLAFNRFLGLGLGALGLLLVAGILTIVGAAVRESVLPPGVEPEASHRRAATRAVGGAAGVVALLLFGGWRWWGAEDAGFVRSMFRPMASEASIADSGATATLTLAVRDSAWTMRRDPTWLRTRGATRRTPLIDDHGKVMHLFLIAEGGGTFAHLHPATTDSVRFTSPLPPVPPGRYRVFGEIVHESGLAQTLVSTVVVDSSSATRDGATSDPDDGWTTVTPGRSARVRLTDGSTITWLRDSAHAVAGEDASLRFVVAAPDGPSSPLEPYMGMPGHAAVMRDDGAVFVHLHPSGTISMAAQRAFELRRAADTVPGSVARRLSAPGAAESHRALRHGEGTAIPAAVSGDTLAFPYAFPQPGRYFVWVQVKRDGRVLTGGFETLVR